MMELTASKALRGEVTVPGDKSISHRSVMFGAIAQGTTEVTNFYKERTAFQQSAAFKSSALKLKIHRSAF